MTLHLFVLSAFFWQAVCATALAVGINERDYKFESKVQPDILVDRPTELWARIYAPDLEPYRSRGEKLPLLVFLHGNHATCGHGTNPRIDDNLTYTVTGKCPEGYMPTPNHRGYDYVARDFAAAGYIVVSINANRGINGGAGIDGDFGLNLARGRLVLAHLALLSGWNRNNESEGATGINLNGMIDFSRVGLMGHSRGGEGMRAAFQQYKDTNSPWPGRIGPITVRGIFEIGPVDGQTARTLDAVNTAWSVLLPLCDGDVSSLEGVRPFDRMVKTNAETIRLPKSTFLVWGANHNFFNTEWQLTDSNGCSDHAPIFQRNGHGSEAQVRISSTAMKHFFGAQLNRVRKNDSDWMFNPKFRLPDAILKLTAFGRDYVPSIDRSAIVVLESFENFTASRLSWSGDVTASVVNRLPLQVRPGVAMTWKKAGGNVQITLPKLSMSSLSEVELNVLSQNAMRSEDFDVRFVDSNGAVSPNIRIGAIQPLAGTRDRNVLQTIPIPTSRITGVDLSSIVAMRFAFTYTTEGSIIIGGLRGLVNSPQGMAGNVSEIQHEDAIPNKSNLMATNRITPQYLTGSILSIADGDFQTAHKAEAATQTLTAYLMSGFPVRDQLTILYLNQREYKISSLASDRRQISFQIPASDLKQMTQDVKAKIAYGRLNEANLIVDLGQLGELN